ncbi:unnamed protein product [Cylicocyclus nassatus]|uniref:Uncharacterized protein n=1 Tax=Cylicocyclus nassatus TaxID=53992 RepID=A0AA36GN39_CYLNA|nr:unnamed protein product [Cylicocyclus nassatus]
MIECQLSTELENSWKDSLVQQLRLKTFFIGSSASFEAYMKSIIPSEDWIKRLLQSTLSFVSDTLGRTQVICFHGLRLETNNAPGLLYMVQTNPVQSCIWSRLILYYPVMLTRHELTDCVPKWLFLIIYPADGFLIEDVAMSSRTPVGDPFPHFY